jgi:SAM-dependent methyltransferase
MHLSPPLPWQLKVAAKLLLARLPLTYHVWNRVGAFRLGGMEQPEYAVKVFRRHFEAASAAREKGRFLDFVTLEMGPGDSLFSALIARTFGASHTYLVDVGSFATKDLAPYRQVALHLRRLGLQPPNLANCSSLDQFMAICSAEYLTKGLSSLRKIPTASVDFIWSHAVLAHVRRDDFLPTLRELRRIQGPDGVGSHHTGFGDILGGKLNDLRFNARIWESSFMAKSGFYTNRIRFTELLQLFREANFAPEVIRSARWETLPTPRRKMSYEFAMLPEDELRMSELDVLLR